MDCPKPFQFDDDGRCRYTLGFTVVDEFGHPLDGDWDVKGHHGCRHTDTPEWKAAHRRKKTKVKQMEQHEQPNEQHHAEQAAPAPATTALTGVADALPFDLTKVIPASGSLSGAAVALGGLAIMGGVLLKVVPAWLQSRATMATQRLALKAKRMELEQQQKDAEKQNGDCAARHAAALAAISALEQRVQLVEKQADGLALDIASAKDTATKLSLTGNRDTDHRRIVALEEQVAALQEKAAGTTQASGA